MRRIPKYLILACLLYSPISSFAIVAPKNLPQELIYENQPIDPLCLEHPSPKNGLVSLDKCGLQSDSNIKIKSYNNKMFVNGFVGYDYTRTDKENKSAQSEGYSYYKSFTPKGSHYHVVYLRYSAGGSGQFSSLLLVKREHKNLRIKTLRMGDRCNNGIDDVQQKNNKLTYTVNMTAFDFIDLAKINPHQLTPYNDLAACATCCQAKAIFERDLAKMESKDKLIAVNLDRESNDIDQGKYQICFNDLIKAYKKNEHFNLTPEDLKNLVKKFNTQCIKQKS